MLYRYLIEHLGYFCDKQFNIIDNFIEYDVLDVKNWIIYNVLIYLCVCFECSDTPIVSKYLRIKKVDIWLIYDY